MTPDQHCRIFYNKYIDPKEANLQLNICREYAKWHYKAMELMHEFVAVTTAMVED
jgi:hypothetical protein